MHFKIYEGSGVIFWFSFLCKEVVSGKFYSSIFKKFTLSETDICIGRIKVVLSINLSEIDGRTISSAANSQTKVSISDSIIDSICGGVLEEGALSSSKW